MGWCSAQPPPEGVGVGGGACHVVGTTTSLTQSREHNPGLQIQSDCRLGCRHARRRRWASLFEGHLLVESLVLPLLGRPTAKWGPPGGEGVPRTPLNSKLVDEALREPKVARD